MNAWNPFQTWVKPVLLCSVDRALEAFGYWISNCIFRTKKKDNRTKKKDDNPNRKEMFLQISYK